MAGLGRLASENAAWASPGQSPMRQTYPSRTPTPQPGAATNTPLPPTPSSPTNTPELPLATNIPVPAATAANTAVPTNTATPGATATNTLVPAVPTDTPTPQVSATATRSPGDMEPWLESLDQSADLYAGPGTQYVVVGRLLPGDERRIVGRARGLNWWLIPAATDDGVAWVSNLLVLVHGDTSGVPYAVVPPTPTHQATASPGPAGETPTVAVAIPVSTQEEAVTGTATSPSRVLSTTPTAATPVSPAVSDGQTALSMTEALATSALAPSEQTIIADGDGLALGWLLAGVAALIAAVGLFLAGRREERDR